LVGLTRFELASPAPEAERFALLTVRSRTRKYVIYDVLEDV